MQDEKLCDKVKISGLGLPSEMVSYTKNGCAPEFALWSFVDLGYLTYYTSYMLATDALKAEEGAKFKAGRMGEYTITKDPTRAKGTAYPDGTVHGLQQGQCRGGGEVIRPKPRSTEMSVRVVARRPDVPMPKKALGSNAAPGGRGPPLGTLDGPV